MSEKQQDVQEEMQKSVAEDAAAEGPSHGEGEPHDPTTGHEYDGIREYDNPIPGWWAWLFVGTIVFSLLYFFIATITGGQLSPQAAYERDMTAALKKQGGALKADAATLLRLSKDEESLKIGQSIFQTNCVACHNQHGEGMTGPNMTDDYYIHVKKITDIPDVITKGRNNGAMPAWGNRLSPNDIVEVAAYVASLRGKNLPGKPPEGAKIAPWSE